MSEITNSTEQQNIASQFHQWKKSLYTPQLKDASDRSKEVMPKLDKFVKENLAGILNDVHVDENDENQRMRKILNDLFSLEDPKGKVNEKLVAEIKNSPIGDEFIKLSEENNEMRKLWDQAKKDAKGIFDNVFNLFDRNKEAYSKYVDKTRLKPNEVSNPHPDNVRVSSATTQDFLADKTYINLFIEAAKKSENNTMDMVINNTGEKIKVTRPCDDGEPSVQKPVSTPVENKDAWKKSDNDKDGIKRIVIIIDSGDDFSDDAKKLQGIYTKQSAEEYRNSTDPNKENKFRVDEIILVKQPTEKESKNGVTFKDKIEEAFKKAKEISDEAKQNGNKAEGIAHWNGHGDAKESSDSKNGDKRFREGSMEYEFLGAVDNDNNIISESTMKEWEKKYLSSYEYFIQSLNTCHSGAAIANNTNKGPNKVIATG